MGGQTTDFKSIFTQGNYVLFVWRKYRITYKPLRFPTLLHCFA